MSVKPKLLIVEDEGIIAFDIQMQLTKAGFAVTGIAASAEEAFRLIESTAPDLVLMDIRIQGQLDGVEAAQIIRERYRLPVIYLTAHADDTTLQRAQDTEPYGYVTKPLANTDIRAIAIMALHRHRLHGDLENQRNMLSTILQNLPDAIVVTDLAGQVLFLNQAAEQLTGWTRQSAIGRKFVDVVRLEDGAGRTVSSELLQQALSQTGLIRIPRDGALVTKNGDAIDVSGQLSATSANRSARIFLTLNDITIQKREEKQLSQEQQLFVAGELARDIAKEFYGLFDLMENSIDGPGRSQPDDDLRKRACEIGVGMSLNLIEFREAHSTAQPVNVSECLLGAQSLLERSCACGEAIKLEIAAGADLRYVLSTGGHFLLLLTHLVLNGKQRLSGRGKIAIRADVQDQALSSYRSSSYVRLIVTSERDDAGQTETDGDADFLGEEPDLNLPIVRAIVTASGGFTRVSELSAAISVVEVFLPRQESRISRIANGRQEVIMVVGLPLRLADTAQRAAGESALLLEAASLNEARLVAELYLGEIDLVVINVDINVDINADSEGLSKTSQGAGDRLRLRRPLTDFIEISSPGSHSGIDALNPSDLARLIEDVLNRRRARGYPLAALTQGA